MKFSVKITTLYSKFMAKKQKLGKITPKGLRA